MGEKEIISMIKEDAWMMSVLQTAGQLRLPDWMIGAGFLRNKVWDFLHQHHRTVADTNDIDLVYYDAANPDEERDRELSRKMNGVLGLRWEIVNQAYTHRWHHRELPYHNTTEALAEWVETATCVAVTLDQGEPRIIAPHGIADLVNLIVRPSPAQQDLAVFRERISSKNWLKKWPKLQIIDGLN